jgi:hypothetical protein
MRELGSRRMHNTTNQFHISHTNGVVVNISGIRTLGPGEEPALAKWQEVYINSLGILLEDPLRGQGQAPNLRVELEMGTRTSLARLRIVSGKLFHTLARSNPCELAGKKTFNTIFNKVKQKMEEFDGKHP